MLFLAIVSMEIILYFPVFSTNLIKNELDFIEDITNVRDNSPNIYIKGSPEIYGILNKLSNKDASENINEDISKNINEDVSEKVDEDVSKKVDEYVDRKADEYVDRKVDHSKKVDEYVSKKLDHSKNDMKM